MTDNLKLEQYAKLSPLKNNLKTVRAHTLGWLRRPDLDDEHCVNWEMPNGAVFACHREGPRHMLVRLSGKFRDRFVLVEVM